jgi:hypothetical protein
MVASLRQQELGALPSWFRSDEYGIIFWGGEPTVGGGSTRNSTRGIDRGAASSPLNKWRSPTTCIGNFFRSASRANSISVRSAQCFLRKLHVEYRSGKRGQKTCYRDGDVFSPFAWDLRRLRKHSNLRASFIAHRARSSDTTWPNIRLLRPRCGRGVTVPPRPRSRPRDVVLTVHLPKRCRRRAGRRCSRYGSAIGHGIRGWWGRERRRPAR